MKLENIRNFSIIAHIDHGKSTLADRILEHTNSVIGRDMKSQILDSMDLEQERGITIKLNAVQLNYGQYIFHLIDTPGHVDFSYEVSRSLAACEGAILVVDATQGIEAQTLANVYLALERDLTIIPVINKIDLPNSDVEKVKKEIINTFGFNDDEILLVSAKENIGIDRLIEEIINKIPPPKTTTDKLQALIFDSEYESYRGVICLVRIVNGKLKKGDKIKMLSTGATYDIVELGVYSPLEKKKDELVAGEVGYITAAIKNIKDIKVGDTITLNNDPVEESLIGYRVMKPMVYCGLFPLDSKKYTDLKEALEKLQLNDAALVFEPETSESLGFGFRVGFLGMFHMDIIEERIEREFNIDLIATSPSVIYEIYTNDGNSKVIQNPSDMPDRVKIKEIKEPYIYTNIIVFTDYIGPVMELCQNKRGIFINMEYITSTRVNIHYEMPLSEIVYDFFDKLKSYTKGYASFDYEVIGYKPSDLIKLELLINGEKVDALSTIVHKDFAYKRGKAVVEKLKDIIPRQQFEVPIQASVGSKIIARSDIKAIRKNVLAKCYGGDVSRKKKLLEKQKEGKKRMKTIGSVDIPQEAFLSVLSMDEE